MASSTALDDDFAVTYLAVDKCQGEPGHTEGAFPEEGAFLALPVRGSVAAAPT